MAAAPPSQPISIGRLPHQSQSLLSANHPSNSNNPHSTPDPHLNPNSISQGAPGTSPAYSYLGADLAAHNPRWAGTSASPARNTQELSTSWNIHPGPLFVSSPHASNQQLQHQHTGGSNSNYASTSAAGFTNGSAGPSGSMNVGSYTGGGIAGTPMSISNSFYSRFQPHASSSSTSPFGGPGVINPLDPTEFKFSSSPYSRAWAGYGSYTGRSGLSGSYGRGFVGSMESDRMSILEGFYGGKGEKEACRDFSCCGLQLNDLHALVEHFEANHANQYSDLSHGLPSSVQQQMSLAISRGRRSVSGGNRRLVNQSSSSSLAGALGDDEEVSQARARAHAHAQNHTQTLRPSGSNGSLSMSSSGLASGHNSASASPMRSHNHRGGGRDGGASNDVEGGTRVDDMEIGLDLDMDMDMDMDVDMADNQHAHHLHTNGNAHSSPSVNVNASHPGSGAGSPNLNNPTNGMTTFVPGPAMRAGYGLGSMGGSRATSPPDTPLLATPVSPGSGVTSQSNSGFSSPIPVHCQQQSEANTFQGFVAQGGAQGSGAGQGQSVWGENAMTPMPMVVMKREDSQGNYFAQQEEDSRSVGTGTSEGSNSPQPPPSSASTSTSNLNSTWDDGSKGGENAIGQPHHGLTHTQSLFALRAQAQAQEQQMQAAGFGASGNEGAMHAGGPTEFTNYSGVGVGMGLGAGMGMGGAGGLVDRAAAQRAREREEALLRSGSGVFNGYAAYADWSRGFPGVADSEHDIDEGLTTVAPGRIVGPTESGVHPGLLFGKPSAGAGSGSGSSIPVNGKKETKRVNLKVGLPSNNANKSSSSPATPLTGAANTNAAVSAANTSNANASGSGTSTSASRSSPSSGGSPGSDSGGIASPTAGDVAVSSNAGGSSLLLSKPFKCPTPGCTKSYKQANGLKYHVTHGQCSFTPPPELSSLTALSALASSSLSATAPNSPHAGPGRDNQATTLSAGTLDKLKASLSLTTSGNNAPLTLLTAEATLARLSAEERREVEREAERRLRPFCCAVSPCQRRYKNMNGLRYHYAHSGEHGRIGMRLLSQGKGGTGGGGSGASSPVKENGASGSGSGSGSGMQMQKDEKKKMTASAPGTPKVGTFVQQGQVNTTQLGHGHGHQQMGTGTTQPMTLPPFPFPFAFPPGMNLGMYSAFQMPLAAPAQSPQPQAQTQTPAQTPAQTQNSKETTNTNTAGAGSGPRMGSISTTGSVSGMVLSQPASAYASPWSSRAPSPTRASSQSPLSQQLQAAQLSHSQQQLTSPVEEPPRSAFPGDDGDEEEEGEDGEEGDEFGYPEEVEEEMIEREAAAAAM